MMYRLSVMNKIIYGVVDLNLSMHSYLQSSKETRTLTVMRINSILPLALRMPLNSPSSRGLLGSGISSQQR